MSDADSAAVAIVTGGSSGIGQACVRALSAAGYVVAVFDLNEVYVSQQAGELAGPVHSYMVDVSLKDSIEAAVKDVADRCGRVDALVTAAGHLDFAPIESMPEQMLSRMLDVHLKGTIFSVQAVLPCLKAAGEGRIVCVSSVGARRGHAQASHYTAAKAGIVGFVKSACLELGDAGITVNAILPGAVDTPMLASRDPKLAGPGSRIPVGRIGQPEDIAAAVRFLVSPEAAYITGAELVVSGGGDV